RRQLSESAAEVNSLRRECETLRRKASDSENSLRDDSTALQQKISEVAQLEGEILILRAKGAMADKLRAEAAEVNFIKAKWRESAEKATESESECGALRLESENSKREIHRLKGI